jgi:thiol:disulfide interchange protein DsbD
MKSIFLLLAGIVITSAAVAQNPVSWTFSSKKINANQYEIQMTATIQKGWHLYSQSQPGDAIAQPTSISFNRNPLVSMEGKIKEVGTLEKIKDEVLDVSANQYSNRVVFVQRVKKKAKANTNLTGNLSFQTCNDEKCLPPKTIPFTVALN